MSRLSTGRIAAIVIIFLFIVALFQNDDAGTYAFLPSFSRTKKLPSYPPTWLRERMALSEKSWKKSVELRETMAASHPANPKIPFFPTDFLKYPFTVWDFFPATWTCPHDFQRVGRLGDGGKWVCGMSIYESIPTPKPISAEDVEVREAAIQAAEQGLVIYSFGINGESSFEAEMLERAPSARIWGYDFSVEGWGKQIPTTERHRTFFKKVGLGKEDKHEENPAFWTLPTLMKENNHTYIDILKIDIEGSEYDALDTFMDAFDGVQSASGKSVLPIGQVMIELHLGNGDITDKVDFERFRKWWERLEKMGMRPAWIEINLFAVTLGQEKSNPRCTEYVWVNAKDERSVLWRS
ncbi:uncharacterized protein EKO05_0009466 [Ascochyta rabiei]|uniref:Uncharacterized protein n=1 Tax=Didymella rabiei TaxID=5454 RepID=A0A163GR73_DIDRA|nr:uncharacterized protein EKO05_0009466 [Ascochyta rabiei]KZM24973.1 hypothetical protein ST47_g3867 [Ascochyta rabiei]UPX19197.1 hypothetical protein EKO05_0009466 [Ascochyta rabiei]